MPVIIIVKIAVSHVDPVFVARSLSRDPSLETTALGSNFSLDAVTVSGNCYD